MPMPKSEILKITCLLSDFKRIVMFWSEYFSALVNKLITMENFKELENNEYNLLIDLNKDRIKLNNKITTNVETNIKNRYQTYMNDKSNSVIKEEFCRYIDVNTFITETTIMDELNSVYSDYILFTL